MSLPQDMMTKEDWDRMERGLPPRKPVVIKRPDPEPPVVEDLIKFEDIPLNDFNELAYANIKTIKNADGVNFIFYDVKIILSSTAQLKRRPGRPRLDAEEPTNEPKVLIGSMIEGDFHKFYRSVRDKVNPSIVKWS